MTKTKLKPQKRDEFPWMTVYYLRVAVVGGVLLLLAIAWIARRNEDDTIRSYTIPKKHTHRILAAIVPSDTSMWFVKLHGPDEPVADQQEQFVAFIESMEFEDREGDPEWKLPKGWKKRSDGQRNMGPIQRFATIDIKNKDKNKKLEVAISKLPGIGQDVDDSLLMITNMWRGQLSLNNLDHDQFAEKSKEIEVGELTAYYVAMAGTSKSTPHSAQPPSAAPPSSRPSVDLKFKVPDGWEETANTAFSSHAFAFAEGDKNIKVTISSLTPSPLLPNVNRWRTGVGLKEIEESDLEQLEKLKLGDVTGTYVEAIGDEQAVLGVIAERDGQAWYIKLDGDPKLAAQQEEQFKSFVESIRFE